MADAHDDIDELEGDIDIEDFEAWHILDYNDIDNNQCKNEENSQNKKVDSKKTTIVTSLTTCSQESPSMSQKTGSVVKKLKIVSKSKTTVSINSSHASSSCNTLNKDVSKETSTKECILEIPDTKFELQFSSPTKLAKIPTKLAKSFKTKGNTLEDNYVVSGIGDIAGIFSNIDSQVVDIVKTSQKEDALPKHLMKKTSKIGKKPTDVVQKKNDSKSGQILTFVKNAAASNPNKKNTSEKAKDDIVPILKLEEEANKPQSDCDSHEKEDNMKRGGRVVESAVLGKCEETDTQRILTEEQSKLIDLNIAMDMVKSVKNIPISHITGEKYVVTFSPVDIADLAAPSVQSLIQSQPRLLFFFRKQMETFKKKKGYGEVLLSKSDEVKDLLLKLIPVKLIEKDIEITITGTFLKWKNFNGSYSLNLKKADKLLKLINAGGNFSKTVPITKRKHFVIEDVPTDTTYVACKTLFPFSTFVVFQKESEKRPVKIFYNDWSSLNTVLDCCSNFKLNDQSLTIQVPEIKKDHVPETAVKETKDKTSQGEKPQIMKEKDRKNKDTDVEINVKIIEQLEFKEPLVIQEVTDKSHEVTEDKNDGITSVTRDVCSDMLESLNKLRQLETDDPNVQKILEMQSQLAKFQKSLSKKGKSGTSSEEDVGNLRQDPPAKAAGRETSLSVEEDKFEGEGSNKHSNEVKRFKHMQETKIRKSNDLEERRKASVAKKMIEEGKGSLNGNGEGNDSTKEQVSRPLKLKEAFSSPGSQPSSSKNESLLSEGDGSAVCKSTSRSMRKRNIFEADLESSNENLKHPKLTSKAVMLVTEEEFSLKFAQMSKHVLPKNCVVQVGYVRGRHCPVDACPTTKSYWTKYSFVDHWTVFHRKNMAVRSCHKCSAYFTQDDDLKNHLKSQHSISDFQTVDQIIKNAKVKVVSNPGFREPWPFTFSDPEKS